MEVYYELAYMHLTVYQFSSEELPSDPLKMKSVSSVCFHTPRLSSPTTYIYILGSLAWITKENGYSREEAVETFHFLVL